MEQTVPYILGIEGAGQETYSVSLSDGSSFFVSADFLLANDIAAGDDTDSGLVSSLETEDEFVRCRRKAAAMIARKEHSLQGLRLKLMQKQFSAEAISRVSELLLSRNLLNDVRFGVFWGESRLRRKPCSISFLEMQLRNQGLSRQDAAVAIEKIDSELKSTVLERAFNKLYRKHGTSRPEKIYQNLVKLGFRYTEAERILRDHDIEISSPFS